MPQVKDPTKVAAGQSGARKRWGEPRIVRLDALTPDERAVVLALVDSMRKGKPDAAQS
jgi:hypothetical protein